VPQPLLRAERTKHAPRAKVPVAHVGVAVVAVAVVQVVTAMPPV
jgi:hypothetical protein